MLDIPESIGYVPDSQLYHLIITSASGSWSCNLFKLQIMSIGTIQYKLSLSKLISWYSSDH